MSGNLFDNIDHDILTLLILNKYTTEQSYIDLTYTNRRLNKLSYSNSLFLEFLKRFKPKELKKVIEKAKYYKVPDEKLKYYHVHSELYPEQYEETVFNREERKLINYEEKMVDLGIDFEYRDEYTSIEKRK